MKARAPAKRTPSPLLLVNIRQLLTLRPPGKTAGPRRGPELNQIGMIEDAAVFAAGGKIVAAGRQRDVLRHAAVRQHKKKLQELDCAGKVVLPGFVDSHTHPVFMEPRLLDFEKRIAGGTYEEIASQPKNVGSEALSAFMFHQASQPDPLDLIGAMFVIEGLGKKKAAHWAELLRTDLHLTPQQTSFLTYHGKNDDTHFDKLVPMASAAWQ